MNMFGWDDIQSFCDDLSKWMIETNTVDELKLAHPKGEFPLRADPKEDDEQTSWDTLCYLTLWICCKAKSKAPDCLESRILLSEKNLKGPWAKLYVKLMQRGFKDPEDKWFDIWNLAG